MYVGLFDGLCRICLQHWSPDLLTSLVDGDSLSDHGKAVLIFADVLISPNDSYPQNICPKCLTLLKQAILFKMTCERTQSQLNKIKNKTQSSHFKDVLVKYCLHRHYSPEKPFHLPDESISTEHYKFGDPITGEMVINERRYQQNTEKDRLGCDKKETRKDKAKCTPKPQYAPTCDICNKAFSSKGSLQAHIPRHGEKKFACEACDKKFSSSKELQMHGIYKHDHQRKYHCTHCDFEAKDSRQLKVHINKHLGLRPYKCDVCTKSFYSVQIYRVHVRNHKIGKQFKCDQCTLTFYDRNQLNYHLKRMHGKKYLYRCNVPDCPTTLRDIEPIRKHLAEMHRIPRNQQGKIQRIAITLVRLKPDSAKHS